MAEKTPEKLIKALKKDSKVWPNILKFLVNSPDTPLMMLKQLAGDDETDVRIELANNPNTPSELLQQLTGDENYEVREALAKNPSAPLEANYTYSPL